MSPVSAANVIFWQGVRLILPPEWEMLRLARERKQGRLGFADRYHLRLEVSYRTLAGAPDLDRLRHDYRTQLKENEEVSGLRPTAHGAWEGFTHKQAGWTLSRFGQWFPHGRRLLEAVFRHPAERDRELEHAVLDGMDVLPADRTRETWQAYGLQLDLPTAWELQAQRVEPANVVFAWGPEGEREVPRVEAMRLGMTRFWLDRPAHQWLAARKEWKGFRGRWQEENRAGHRLQVYEGRKRQLPVVGTSTRRRAAVWTCPEDERIYALTHDSPLRRPAEPVTLTCCPACNRTLP